MKEKEKRKRKGVKNYAAQIAHKANWPLARLFHNIPEHISDKQVERFIMAQVEKGECSEKVKVKIEKGLIKYEKNKDI